MVLQMGCVMNRRLVTGICVLGAALFCSSSWAATKSTSVDPAKGVVLVNRGHGFVQISKPVKLKVGNAVMVGPDGGAIITYADGCPVNVIPGTVETIAALSPCASGASAAADNSNHWGYCSEWQNCGFWAVWAGGAAFVGYEISQISP
jgi:hypothetical protein